MPLTFINILCHTVPLTGSGPLTYNFRRDIYETLFPNRIVHVGRPYSSSWYQCSGDGKASPILDSIAHVNPSRQTEIWVNILYYQLVIIVSLIWRKLAPGLYQHWPKASQVYTCRQAYPMLISFISWILDNTFDDAGDDWMGQEGKMSGLFFRRNPDYKNQLSFCNF